MDAAVVGGIVGGATQVAVEKLLLLISHYFDQDEDFIADMEKLKSNLKWAQAVLDDVWMQHITSSRSRVVKLWLRELQEVSDDAYHALDEFHYHLLHEKRNKIDAQTSVFKKFESLFSDDPREILRLKIKEINDKLDSFRNRGADDLQIRQMILGLPNYTSAVGEAAFTSPETDSFTVDPVFIGREKDVSAIVEMLANVPTEGALSILPIVGMGGLGKTTLARKVFHHERVITHFPSRIWVHVSTTFDSNTLFKKILEVFTLEEVNVKNRQVVLAKLQKVLADKAFLLILDDVWNQDPRVWEDFLYPLSSICSIKGNCIIVTTRNSQVGSVVRTLPTYELQGLSEEGCWAIIKERAFGKRDIPEIPLEEFHGIGKNIAKRCQGLPLAASVVGGLLCGKSKDDWISIEKNWLSNFDGDQNNISKILKLSFHHLPSPSLKKCFAFCSFFGKGARIRREKLIELWMAEGFLPSSDMENVGNKYFNLLLQNSLLQFVSRDVHSNAEYYGMHDLVHDLADSISNDIYNGRYIRWKCNGDASSHIPEEKVKRCHALSYEGAISDIKFSDFKSLHSLTLIGCNINFPNFPEELSESIRELIHLRCLDISNTSIKHLPESMGELYHLQTLRICKSRFRTSWVKKLPSTLKYLFNLRHLHVSVYTELPPHVGMLTSLRTLRYFKVRGEDGHRIVELERLNNLQGELKIYNLEKVQGVEEFEKANLSQKSGISRLALRWDKRRKGEINDEDLLKGLEPPPSLEKLAIYGFKGASFPPWASKMTVCVKGLGVGLNNLMEIRLHNCEECDEIPTMGHLPRLKSLFCWGLRSVKSIGSSIYGIDRCSSNTGICRETINVFPALERLRLWDMPNLREWTEVEISSEARDIKVFPRLKHLEIWGCKQLANICRIKSTSLTHLEIDGLDELVCLPDSIYLNNPNLSVLRIRKCPKLRELPDDLQTITSLRELRILDCHYLKPIPYFRVDFTRSLQRLSLSDLDCEFLPDDLQHLSSLKNLCLMNCEQLRSLPSVEAMRRLTNLKELHISGCPLLEERCESSDDDSEWPKISHIPYIYVDGRVHLNRI